MNYNNLTDEKIVELFKNGDDLALDFLMHKYKSLVLGISRSYFLSGGDQDDLVQEGMIGFYKACCSYNFNNNASFATFARMCVTRNIQSAVKSANTQKNKTLNKSIFFSELTQQNKDGNEEDVTLFIPSTTPTPDEKLVEEEKLKEIKKEIIERLSQLELKVLKYYLKGMTYKEISLLLNETPKSIDNALNRIKNKLGYLKTNK